MGNLWRANDSSEELVLSHLYVCGQGMELGLFGSHKDLY